MGNQKVFIEKNKILTVIVVLLLLAVIISVVAVINLSYGFKPAPTVEVKAENKFKRTLYVVTDKDYAPYSYVDANGNYTGLDVELMNEIANRIQMNLDLKLENWTDAVRDFEDGEADLIMNADSDLIVNNPNVIATLPTTEKQDVVYGYREVKSVADLYGRRVASLHRMSGLGLDDEISYVIPTKKFLKDLKAANMNLQFVPYKLEIIFWKNLMSMMFSQVTPSCTFTALWQCTPKIQWCA